MEQESSTQVEITQQESTETRKIQEQEQIMVTVWREVATVHQTHVDSSVSSEY